LIFLNPFDGIKTVFLPLYFVHIKYLWQCDNWHMLYFSNGEGAKLVWTPLFLTN